MIEEQRLEGQFNLLLEYVIIIQRILEDIQSNEIDVNSLRDIRLSTNYFDLLHPHILDYKTSSGEIMPALDDMVSEGRFLYAGFFITRPISWQKPSCLRIVML